MKKGKVVTTVSGSVLIVFLIASLLLGPVNVVYAQQLQLLTPLDGALIECDPVSGRSHPIAFSWSPFNGSTSYKFQLAKDAAMTVLVDEAEVATTAYEQQSGMVAVECGHTYYWRVRALEPTPSDWSATWSLTIKAGLPVPTPYYGPQLLAPNNGCLGCPVSPALFSWSPFKETTKYKFVLATDAAMTQVVTEAEVACTAFEYDGTLTNSTNYFWRVMSLEPGPSDWSTTFSFMTEAAPEPVIPPPPLPPSTISPAGGVFSEALVTFTWTQVSDPSGATYVLEIANILSFFPLEPGMRKVGLTQATCTVDVQPGTYYWRVKAVDGAGNESQWALSPYPFEVETAVDTAAPMLLSPSNGSLGCPVSPASFSWSPVQETTKYKFVLATDAAMTQVVTEAEVTGAAFEYDGTLNYSTTYFWRIMALEPAPSDWSATFSFMTEAAPAPAPAPPSVTTNDATNVKINSAILNGNLDSLGNASTVDVSFEWGTNSEVYAYATPPRVMDSIGPFSFNLTGLTAGTIYYFRAKTVGDDTSYGAEFSFQTKAEPTSPPPQQPKPSAGMGCTNANIGQTTTSSDISPLLLGVVLFGLVFVRRRKLPK